MCSRSPSSLHHTASLRCPDNTDCWLGGHYRRCKPWIASLRAAEFISEGQPLARRDCRPPSEEPRGGKQTKYVFIWADPAGIRELEESMAPDTTPPEAAGLSDNPFLSSRAGAGWRGGASAPRPRHVTGPSWRRPRASPAPGSRL